MGSVADAIDNLEVMREARPSTAGFLAAVIEKDLLPAIDIAGRLREAAAKIDVDGTPSQVGPVPAELRAWADLICPASSLKPDSK